MECPLRAPVWLAVLKSSLLAALRAPEKEAITCLWVKPAPPHPSLCLAPQAQPQALQIMVPMPGPIRAFLVPSGSHGTTWD